MGILILIEGPFLYSGCDHDQRRGRQRQTPGRGITLRRTTLRDRLTSSTRSRSSSSRVYQAVERDPVYSLATVEVQVLRPADLDRAIAVAGRVARELVAERGWDRRRARRSSLRW